MTVNALFITYHNWKDKRIGGFHYLAAALAERGDDVGFFSFPRPLITVLTSRSERCNARTMVRLSRGVSYSFGKGSISNFTAPTLGMPGRLGRALGPVNYELSRATVPPLQLLLRRRAPKVDVCVVESTVGVCLLEMLRRCYPHAVLIYRPSDPLVANPNCPAWLARAEQEMLAAADVVLLVNEEGRETYLARFGAQFVSELNCRILENGVNYSAFQKRYPRPKEFVAERKVVLYLGAAIPDWASILGLAAEIPEATVCVVCPERPQKKWLRAAAAYKNFVYIDGVAPDEVPAYVTNCDVFAVAYPPGLWRHKPWGFHAKLQQAIAARKPVVGINVNPSLERYGIVVAKDAESFAESVKAALLGELPAADCAEVAERDWEGIKARFVAHVDAALEARKRVVR